MVLSLKYTDSMLCFVDTQKNCLTEHAEIFKNPAILFILKKKVKNLRIMRLMSITILACLPRLRLIQTNLQDVVNTLMRVVRIAKH